MYVERQIFSAPIKREKMLIFIRLGDFVRRRAAGVARWFRFKTKIPIWVNFGGP
jgi:hypothetical protein